MHSAKKTRDTTLDNESALQHVTAVVVTVLCNQPEAFASDLGDDQSRYLYYRCICCFDDTGMIQVQGWCMFYMEEKDQNSQSCH